MQNDVFVSVDTMTGTLRRLVANPLLLTHEAKMGSGARLDVDAVEHFRQHPSERFRIRRNPWVPPTNGGSPMKLAA